MIFNTSVCLTLAAALISTANAIPQSHHHHKRSSNTCSFPDDAGLVAVTPKSKNGGWALHEDTACTAGSYCPYACPAGQVMAQWDPELTSYTYPESQYGGLKCNSDGTVSKPFPNKPYCVDGEGTVKVDNKVGSDVAICQTVLPGNEEMLIPTNAEANELTTLAVPGTDYWAQTAAHYYVNPPGVSTSEGCIWGSTANPYGNWSPYVLGANMDSNKNTFVKIGWNPKYLDDFSSKTPDFGIRITCDDESKCNGLKCEIDPSNGVNSVTGPQSSDGAGGAKFCVVTAEQGSTAKIEIFSTGSKQKRDGFADRKISDLFNDNFAIKGVNSTSNSTSETASIESATNGAANLQASQYLALALALGVFGFSSFMC